MKKASANASSALVWHNEKRMVNNLIPFDQNPRKMTEDQVKQLTTSLEKFGLVEIPAIDTDDVIVAGHQRMRIMQLIGLGDEEIDVRVPNRKLTPAEFKEYNVRSNKNVGMWDDDLLASLFDINELRDIGFSEVELGNLDFDTTEDVKDDILPEIPDVPKSKLGDLYEFGGNRVLCGDSTSEEDVEKLMDGQLAAMCFTDPPYNVNYTGGMGTHEKNARTGILNDSMSSDDFREFLEKALKPIVSHTKGGIYVCMSSSELHALKGAFEAVGGHWQSFIIWVKNNFTLSRADYQNTYEPILYGWADDVVNHYFTDRRDIANVWEDLSEAKSEYDGEFTTISFQGFKVRIQGKIGKGEIIKKKQHLDIWRYDKPSKSELHPTQKPIALVTEAITNSSKNRDIVLDTFLGSGSTLIACAKTNRICYGMELDPKYVDVIIKRWCDYTGFYKVMKNGKEIEID